MQKKTEANSTAQRLTNSINEVLAFWIDTGTATNAKTINSGNCSEFSVDVMINLGGLETAYDLGINELDIAGLLEVGDGPDNGPQFDRELLATHWPNIQPPDGLTWDDLDQLSVDADFDSGTHVWLVLDGKHYDAEAPEGVENLFDLPFFRRIVDTWVNEKRNTPSP